MSSSMRSRDGFSKGSPFQVRPQFGQLLRKFFRRSRSLPEEFMMFDKNGGFAKKQCHCEGCHSIPVVAFEDRKSVKRVLCRKKEICAVNLRGGQVPRHARRTYQPNELPAVCESTQR